MKGWRLGVQGPVCLCFPGTSFQLPPHISQLTLVWELNKMKGLKLEELWLEGNPSCDTFPGQSTYISSPFLGTVAPWVPELSLRMHVCRKLQPWSSERTIGSTFSFLCVPHL